MLQNDTVQEFVERLLPQIDLVTICAERKSGTRDLSSWHEKVVNNPVPLTRMPCRQASIMS